MVAVSTEHTAVVRWTAHPGVPAGGTGRCAPGALNRFGAQPRVGHWPGGGPSEVGRCSSAHTFVYISIPRIQSRSTWYGLQTWALQRACVCPKPCGDMPSQVNVNLCYVSRRENSQPTN